MKALYFCYTNSVGRIRELLVVDRYIASHTAIARRWKWYSVVIGEETLAEVQRVSRAWVTDQVDQFNVSDYKITNGPRLVDVTDDELAGLAVGDIPTTLIERAQGSSESLEMSEAIGLFYSA